MKKLLSKKYTTNACNNLPDGWGHRNKSRSGVYKITNTVNGRFYVGSTVSLGNRRSSHISTLSKGRHRNYKLQKDWRVYGEGSFIFEILEFVRDRTKLVEREQYYFDALKPFIKGYNLCTSAESCTGIKRSPEVVREMSRVRMGKIPSAETRRKLSIAGRGRVDSLATRRKKSRSMRGNKRALGVKQTELHKKRKLQAFNKTMKLKKRVVASGDTR